MHEFDDSPKVEAFFRLHPWRLPTVSSFVPRAWDDIVAETLQDIVKLETAYDVSVRIAQIKEKVGGLRIYAFVDESPSHRLQDVGTVEAARAEVRQLLDSAERRAHGRCFYCGQIATGVDGLYRACASHQPKASIVAIAALLVGNGLPGQA